MNTQTTHIVTVPIGVRLSGLLTLMRPFTWMWFLLCPISVTYFLLGPEPTTWWRFAAFLAAAVFADSGVTTINDVYDLDTDRLSVENDRRHRPLVAGHVSPRLALGFSAFLLCLSVSLSLLANPRFTVGVLLAIAMGLAYSVPPVRLNAKPWASQPFWLTMGLLGYFTIGTMAGSLFSVECVTFCIGMGFFMGVGETLAKDIRDWDNDAKAGKHTSVVTLGPAKAARYSRAAGLVGTAVLLGFLWTVAPVPPFVAAVESALLVYWASRIVLLTGRQQQRFDKRAGMLLHTGYIRTYLIFNIVLLVGMTDRVRAALEL